MLFLKLQDNVSDFSRSFVQAKTASLNPTERLLNTKLHLSQEGTILRTNNLLP